MSKCECGGSSFIIVEQTPFKSNYKLNFVQCSKCQRIVGVMDYYNIGFLVKKQNEVIKKIARKLGITVNY